MRYKVQTSETPVTPVLNYLPDFKENKGKPSEPVQKYGKLLNHPEEALPLFPSGAFGLVSHDNHQISTRRILSSDGPCSHYEPLVE